MSWNRCSELALLAAVLVLVAAAPLAGAISPIETEVPEQTTPGEEASVSVTLDELYTEHQEWELSGSTGLTDASWTVEYYRSGERQNSWNLTGGSIDAPAALDNGTDEPPGIVYVVARGQVPEVDGYDYENGQSFTGLELTGTANGSQFSIDAWDVSRGTEDSRAARTRLEEVRTALDEAESDGVDVSTPASTWEDSVAAFESGNFGEATSTADEAESQLETARSESDGSGGGSGDGGSSDGGSGDGNASTTDSGDGDGSTSDGNGSTSDGDGSSSDGSDDAAGSTGGDGGGPGFLTILLYVIGLAVLVGVAGGAYYLSQQRQGPGRDPLG